MGSLPQRPSQPSGAPPQRPEQFPTQRQEPALQDRPAEQVFPRQHGWPLAPHGTQIRLLQNVEAGQAPLHRPPHPSGAPPHFPRQSAAQRHRPILHTFGALHDFPHLPQFSGSVRMSTHWKLQNEAISQTQDPELQRSAGEQARPQRPQFERSTLRSVTCPAQIAVLGGVIKALVMNVSWKPRLVKNDSSGSLLGSFPHGPRRFGSRQVTPSVIPMT